MLSVDSAFSQSDKSQLVSYSLRERNDRKREIAIRAVGGEGTQENVIFESHMRLSGLKISQQGRVVVAYGGSHVLVGTADAFRPNALGSVQYTWREVPLPANVTCLDIRESEIPARRGSQSSGGGSKPECSIDLVLGQADGSIFIYHDLLSFFPSSKDGREGRKSLAPRKLHWHRGSVNAVSWSRDGMSPRSVGRGRCPADILYR